MDESVYIATPDHVSLEFELAGPGSRFSAYVIDFFFNILLIVVIFLVVFLTGGLPAIRSLATSTQGNARGYYVFFEGISQGSTPGKKRMGIRVIRQDGLPIGLREAALRNLVRAADMLPPPCYLLGGLVMHFDPLGRRLGDMVAGTYVVIEKFELAAQGASGAAWATRVEQGRSRQALTLPRGMISAQQVGLIEQFLARRYELSEERRALLVWQITEPLLSLLGEDRDSLARSADRTDRCEQLLLQVLDLAQIREPHVAVAAKASQPSSLF